MASAQMVQTQADMMLENALAFCADKTFQGDTRQARLALTSGRCDVCDYLCYSLAKQVGEYLGQMDAAVKAVYVFQPEYARSSEATAACRSAGINMIAWVERKSAALSALTEALDAALSERRRKLGCVNATAACYTLNVHLVDDADVRERRGYGALIGSLFVRPIRVWAHAN